MDQLDETQSLRIRVRLSEIVKKEGSIQAAAQALGLSQQMVSSIVHEVRPISLRVVGMLAIHDGVTVASLLHLDTPDVDLALAEAMIIEDPAEKPKALRVIESGLGAVGSDSDEDPDDD